MVYVLGMALCMVLAILGMYPDTLHHPDNYCYVSRYSTPRHIVPEWYFLPFYSMLRACSIKAVGVVLLGAAVLLYITQTLSTPEVHASRALLAYLGPYTRPIH